MKSDTVFIKENLAISSVANAAYNFKQIKSSEVAVTTVPVKVEKKEGKAVSWGNSNKKPVEILDAVKLNGTARSSLRIQKKVHYGNGIILMSEEVNEGKRQMKIHSMSEFKDILEFFKKSYIKRFQKEIIHDLEYFYIAFPEFVLSADYNNINRVKRQKATWCRFEEPNEEGYISYVYISQKFGRSTVDLEGEYAEKVPLIDCYWSADEVKEYCKSNKITKFIRPVFYPMSDEAFYPEADWHSVYENGWLEIINEIPKYKKALFNNQISIKYLIHIHEEYFVQTEGDDWHNFKPDRKKKIRQDLIDTINSSLAGSDKAGKSIQAMKFIDSKGDLVDAIKIEAIDDKFKDGSFLPEASAGNSEISFAIGTDPSLIGAGIPGGKLGAGSGSDKRVAYDILSALKKTDRESSLEPLEFIQQYNGWDESIMFSYDVVSITTLDKNPTGTQNQSG